MGKLDLVNFVKIKLSEKQRRTGSKNMSGTEISKKKKNSKQASCSLIRDLRAVVELILDIVLTMIWGISSDVLGYVLYVVFMMHCILCLTIKYLLN